MTYPGGKNGACVYQQIINCMPPHNVYIEPFLGGGAVMRLKRLAAVNIGLDLDAGAVRQMRRWRPRGILSSGMPLADPASPNLILGDRLSLPLARADVHHRRKRRHSSAARNSEATRFLFERGDGIEFLRSYSFAGGELVYCDPPYLHETRGRRDLYSHEMTDAQHLELLDVIQQLRCHVIISGYWSRLYSSVLKGWDTVVFQTTNRAGRRTTEYLWMNFLPPCELHDYRYLGSDFRERERVKRKKARWVARLERMPSLERMALLAAIAAIAENGDSSGVLAGNVEPAGAR